MDNQDTKQSIGNKGNAGAVDDDGTTDEANIQGGNETKNGTKDGSGSQDSDEFQSSGSKIIPGR